MATVTFGQTSWDSPSAGGGNSGDDFLHLNKDGQYNLRIISESPYEYAVHWADDVNGNVRRVKCSGPGCILCKEGVKPQVRYLIEVIDLDNDNVPKIVEFGAQVFNQIKALYGSKHWGDPRGYDIEIDRKKSRGPSGMYQVMPLNKEPLDADTKAAAVAFKDRIKEVIGKFAEHSTNDEILEKLGRVEASQSASDWASKAQEIPAAEESSGGDADDEDFDF